MTRIKMILRSKSGNSYPLTIAKVLVILIIACACFEYMRLMIIAQGVRDAVQSSIISVSTGNYSDVYASLREGYSGGYVNNDGNGFNEQINTGDVYARLDSLLGLKSEGSYHIKYTDGVMEYRVSDLNITIINAPFAPSDRDTAQKFLAEAVIYLEVPLSFGWSALPSMKINLKVKAGWTPKF
jgi:opacity protein-like surface antigen